MTDSWWGNPEKAQDDDAEGLGLAAVCCLADFSSQGMMRSNVQSESEGRGWKWIGAITASESDVGSPSPEQRLWISVLQQGLAEAARHLLGIKQLEPNVGEAATEWLHSDDEDVCSFLWIVGALKLEVATIRAIFIEQDTVRLQKLASRHRGKYIFS